MLLLLLLLQVSCWRFLFASCARKISQGLAEGWAPRCQGALSNLGVSGAGFEGSGGSWELIRGAEREGRGCAASRLS